MVLSSPLLKWSSILPNRLKSCCAALGDHAGDMFITLAQQASARSDRFRHSRLSCVRRHHPVHVPSQYDHASVATEVNASSAMPQQYAAPRYRSYK